MAPTHQPIFHKDEKVFCFHHEILYEAKILEVTLSDPDDRKSPYEYRVHYKGWKNTWDDWVLADRLRKATEDNKELAATLRRDAEAALRQRSAQKPSKKRAGGSDLASFRDSEERQSSTGRGTKRARDAEIEKEDQFNSRPSVRIVIPDTLKALLVDDWENVTKNKQVVPLPAKYPVNTILDMYCAEEKQKRHDTPEVDVLDEVIAGIKEYFEKSIGRILLYRFEREQYHVLRKSWESGTGDLANKAPGEIYGAEHLARLFASMPELIAQTNMDQQSTNRLREELSKVAIWLSKNSESLFTGAYKTASNEYIEKVKGDSGGEETPTASRLT
ncbi:Esa1p-associated factor [Arachnomyces sp. PD_36]|nr:Esa1p-associated factor [Arachnomyces sp. PD_36]